jgi:hypothetical protein
MLRSEAARIGNGRASALAAAGWLNFAAAPAFAIMALATSLPNEEGAAMMCAPASSPLMSMAVMYALMSAFHLTPWLRFFASWRSGHVNQQPLEQE